MENIQISYDGERVEITFKKGEGVSVCGNSKSWDDLVVPCCMDTEDASKCGVEQESHLSAVVEDLVTALEAIEEACKSTAEEKKKSVPINEDKREACRNAAGSIVHAFVWEQTKEGHDYWSNVYNRLSQIAKDGVL